VSYAFPRSFDVGFVHLGYSASYTFAEEPFGITPDPNEPLFLLPERGFFSGLRFGWTYSNIETYGYDISPSNGRSLSFEVAAAHPALGSQFSVVTLTWSFTNYAPLGAHHVLGFRYGGGVSGGDLDRVGVFGVGGFPVIAPLAGLESPVVLGGVALRGYAPNDRVGTQFHLAQLEYRFPIWRINEGILSLPIYFNRLHATLFTDYGDAFTTAFDLATFRVGIGAELFLDFTLFYVVPLQLRFGYAHGFMEGGQDQVYVHFGEGF
jgi:outer membrane protein assembly factor BamA